MRPSYGPTDSPPPVPESLIGCYQFLGLRFAPSGGRRMEISRPFGSLFLTDGNCLRKAPPPVKAQNGILVRHSFMTSLPLEPSPSNALIPGLFVCIEPLR